MGENLEVGSQAPDFEAETYGAEKVRLSDFYSKGTVALYFYPRDNTPGCTKEACSLRDAERELMSLGVQVLGVSTDGVKSHENFRNKFSLNFPLLSDKSREIVDLYGIKKQVRYRPQGHFPHRKRWQDSPYLEKGKDLVSC